jgi:uncharacterized protein YdeI (BOF family)
LHVTNIRLRTVIAVSMALILGLGLGTATAASPVIGTIVARGAFRVDNATVTGNATLFEGAMVETNTVGSSMELNSGARMTLGTTSKGRVFGDRIVLERGTSRLEKAEGFRVEARGLTIQPETGNSTGRVGLAGATRVEVAALSGTFRVLNSRGMVVAKIASGSTLAFEPQALNRPTHLTGRVVNRGGHYLLTDETTNVTVEVAGPELAKLVGKRVELTGALDPTATPVSEASQFIRVTSAKPLPGAATAAAGAGGTAGGAGGGLAVSGTAIAVIGGVAAAAVVGGLAAAGGLSEGTTAAVSR